MTKFHPTTPKKCPPKGVEDSNGVYYRFVFNYPPTSKDFVIWVLEPENKHLLKERTKKKDCNSFAISMFKEAGISRASAYFLRLMKKKAKLRGARFLGWAKLELDSECGVLKQTGQNPHHFDLWPFISCNLEEKVINTIGV